MEENVWVRSVFKRIKVKLACCALERWKLIISLGNNEIIRIKGRTIIKILIMHEVSIRFLKISKRIQNLEGYIWRGIKNNIKLVELIKDRLWKWIISIKHHWKKVKNYN